MDFHKICRTCLREISNSKCLFDLQYINEEHLKLSEILTACTSIVVLENDNLPKQVCIQCENNILNTFRFQEQCHKSNSLLRAALSNSVLGELTQFKPLSSTEEKSSKTTIQQSNLSNNNTFEQEKANELVNGVENINSSLDEVIKIDLDTEEILKDDNDGSVNIGKDVENVYVNFGHIDSTTDSLKEKNGESNLSSSYYTDSVLSQHIELKPSGILSNYTFKQNQVNNSDETINGQLTSVKILNEDSEDDERNLGYEENIESISYSCNENDENGLFPNYHVGGQQIESNDLPTEVGDETLQTLFPCEVKGCAACFSTLDDLKEHSKEHLRGYCKICNKTFSDGTLSQHMISKHQPEYCRICDKNFSSGTLSQHMSSKHQLEKKSHLCSDCGRDYTRSFNFKRHIQIRKGPFRCEKCGEVFADPVRLLGHMRIHCNVKNFICPVCDENIADYTSLLAHNKTHSNVKSHNCPKCDERFCSPGSVATHLTVHKTAHAAEKNCGRGYETLRYSRLHRSLNPYYCNVCTERFKTSENLMIHTIRVHTRKKSFTCNVCNKSFAHYSNYWAHKKSHKQS